MFKTKNQPLVSVVMSVFNVAPYIKECINSILNQTYTNFECIIIDDNSLDDTVKIIKSYKSKKLILFENDKQLGIPKNINFGIQQAKGKYIIRMDGDDICLKNRFEVQVLFMEDNPNIHLCGSWIKLFGAENGIWKTESNHQFLKTKMFFNNSFAQPSTIIRKTIFTEHNIWYNEACFRAQDYELFDRISEKFETTNIQKILLEYRVIRNNYKKNLSNYANETILMIWGKKYLALNLELNEYFLNYHTMVSQNNYHLFDFKFYAFYNWLQLIQKSINNKYIKIYSGYIYYELIKQSNLNNFRKNTTLKQKLNIANRILRYTFFYLNRCLSRTISL